MFRSGNVPGVVAPTMRRFAPLVCDADVVEQLLYMPLWIVNALEARNPEKRVDDRLWDRYVVGEAEALVDMLASDWWERFVVRVVLPEYVTRRKRPVLARCFAVWDAVQSDVEHPTWYFETDCGSFFDPLRTASDKQAEKTVKRWEDSEVGVPVKRARTTKKRQPSPRSPSS